MKTKTMKAIVATGYGNADVLQLQEVTLPKPKNTEILVRVHATSATTADTMMRTGKPYFARLFLGFTKPKCPIPGTGFAGVVEEVGADASNYKKGDRVFGETTFGFSANAQYLTVPETGVVLLMPTGMDFIEAANFCDGHVTSFNFVKEIAKISVGDKVLINGAAGALGTSAVQIAKYLGAEVTAVCSARNAGLVKSLGADYVIDYNSQNYTDTGNKYDYIYDTVGKSSFSVAKNALRKNGVYLSPVLKFSLLFQMLTSTLFGTKKAKFEATGTNTDEKLRYMLAEVLKIYRDGKLKMVIDRQFPLEKVADAHRYIETGHKRGNVVIISV